MTTTTDGTRSEQLVIREEHLSEDANRILAFLEKQGTFRFPTLSTGLFSAAAGEGTEFELTGYRSVWVRDNVHIAHAHWVWGEHDKAVGAMTALMKFFLQHRSRFTDAIAGRSDPSDPMQRPHIRFDGERLIELNEKWSHAQNDALGAFLWLYSMMAHAGALAPTSEESQLLDDLVAFLHTITFWQDEDSGHWEEVRKVAASSIGVATAGLKWYAEWLSRSHEQSSSVQPFIGDRSQLAKQLIERGQSQLDAILPWESRQDEPTQRRRYDAALLFLIFPYRVLDGVRADEIANDVVANLLGDHGIRRYLGDSYWCADYKQKLAADQRTADFSDNLAARDRLLQPGLEAQWCLFDPILAIHFGLRYERTRDQADRREQAHHLNRSLAQLTRADSRFGPHRCPESYFSENGRYVPNDICPLLWTQANLKLALWLSRGK
jgi:Glycosyl hydrolases family 15